MLLRGLLARQHGGDKGGGKGARGEERRGSLGERHAEDGRGQHVGVQAGKRQASRQSFPFSVASPEGG